MQLGKWLWAGGARGPGAGRQYGPRGQEPAPAEQCGRSSVDAAVWTQQCGRSSVDTAGALACRHRARTRTPPPHPLPPPSVPRQFRTVGTSQACLASSAQLGQAKGD
eukprot:356878-Chlamydomonas_euryale.AAC.6